MKIKLYCFACLLLYIGFFTSLAAATSIRCVPTFENASVYIDGTTLNPSELRIEYKSQTATKWTPGHQLCHSPNDPTPRTSLLQLDENTTYDVRCLDLKGSVLAEASFSTWQEDVPIAKIIQINDLAQVDGAYVLSESGNPDGWVKYVGEIDQTIDGGNKAKQAIRIAQQHHIIVEGLRITGGKRHGIVIDKSHHIRIRHCDISGFGRVGKQDLSKDGKYYTEDGVAINYDAGVAITASSQVLVEHCFVHDPRNHANSWHYSHPAGPNGIFIRAKGQVVIRYNDFIGSVKHRWNDVIEGYGNGKVDGGFTQDSDIYGNYLAFCNDDGIELDGGQCNVRLYGNKIEGALCGISTAPNMRGPSFVYRNLVINLGDERGSTGSAVKNGGGSTHSLGTTYFYHNTFFTRGNGIASVGFGRAKNRSMFIGVSRNNLLCVNGPGIRNQWGSDRSDFDYDYFAKPGGKEGSYHSSRPIEEHAIFGPAGFIDTQDGNFHLRQDSKARSTNIEIAGLSPLPDYGANPQLSVNKTIPFRPIQASVDRQQIRMRIAKNVEKLPSHEIQLRNHGDTPLHIEIDKNSAFDWFHVETQSTTVKPQQTIRLTVNINNMIRQHTGMVPAVFLIRSQHGVRLPVTLYAEVLETDFTKFFQIEDLAGSEFFKKIHDTEALGSAGLDFKKEIFVNPEGKTVSKEIVLTFKAPVTTQIILFCRVKCPEPLPLHDSLFVKLNDGKKHKCAFGGSTTWKWTRMRGDWKARAGTNTLVLSPREQLWIDAIYMTTRSTLAGEPLIEAELIDD